jgi:hypothetical protein
MIEEMYTLFGAGLRYAYLSAPCAAPTARLAREREARSAAFRTDGLQLRYRVRRLKHRSLHRRIPPAASRAHERWSMDFVHEALADGRAFRALTVVDQWGSWSPILEVAQSVSGRTVAEGALDQAIAKHGMPQTIPARHSLVVC